MRQVNDLIKKLQVCPAGDAGWREFENICVEILEFLFVPPLTRAVIQPRTLSGTNRRDAVLPNRNFIKNNNWAILLRELNARMILFEFKNYGPTNEIGHE
jgi:hypothetical protein